MSESANQYFDLSHLDRNLKGRAVRGASLTLFCQVCTQVLQFVGTILLARLLTPPDFGLVAMALSIFQFFMLYRTVGLSGATVQRDHLNHDQVNALFWINVLVAFFLTLLFAAASPVVAWFYGVGELTAVCLVLSMCCLLGGLATQHHALLRRTMQFGKLAANGVCSTALSVILAILVATNGWGYWALVFRRLAFHGFGTLGTWVLCSWRPTRPRYTAGLRGMVQFGLNSVISMTINYVTRNLDKVLIGKTLGTRELGLYDKSYHLFMGPTEQLAAPLGSVGVASLSRLVNQPAEYRRAYLRTLSLLAFVGMPAGALVGSTGTYLTILLLGDQWAEAGPIFSVFGSVAGFQLVYSTHGWVHLSLGTTARWVRWSLISASVFVSSFVIGLQFGSLGVATAYSVALLALTLPCVSFAGRPVGLRMPDLLSVIWRPLLFSILATLASHLILFWQTFILQEQQRLAYAGLLGVSLISIYLALMMLFQGPFSPIKEVARVAHLLRTK